MAREFARALRPTGSVLRGLSLPKQILAALALHNPWVRAISASDASLPRWARFLLARDPMLITCRPPARERPRRAGTSLWLRRPPSFLAGAAVHAARRPARLSAEAATQ